jgi:Zn-dependent protease with chaperone function
MPMLTAFVLAVPIGIWWTFRASPWESLHDASLAATYLIAHGVAIVLAVAMIPGLMGRNPRDLSLVFGPWARAVMVLLAVSALCQSGLFVYTMVASKQAGGVGAPFWILVAVAVAGLICAVSLGKASLQLMRWQPVPVRGLVLERERHPALFALIDTVARRLSTASPDHVVIGLEPTFFVTGQDLALPGREEPLAGRTLVLSAALMRVFDERQLTAVVGHEFGHFRGKDEVYTQRFAPVYRRFSSAFASVSATSGYALIDFIKLPAVHAVRTCIERFATIEHAMRRDREIDADRAACEAADAQALAQALVKVSLFAPFWQVATQSACEALSQGACFRNLSQVFEALCRDGLSRLDWKGAQAALQRSTQAHPFDSHPPMHVRLDAVGTPMSRLTVQDVALPDSGACSLLTQVTDLEAQLTQIEALWLCSRIGVDPSGISKEAMLGREVVPNGHQNESTAPVRG